MRPVFVDRDTRSRALRAAGAGIGAALLCAGLGALADPGGVQLVAVGAALTCLLGGTAAAGLAIQQALLERPADASPATVARWGGTLFAVVAGPLVTAKVTLAVISGAGALLSGGATGAMAGVGLAWLVLPMALLVVGTAALKLPAIAAGTPLDTAGVIDLADGREWSLVPLGLALTLGLVLIVAGAAGILWVGPAALVAAAVGMALVLPVVAALTRRWQTLQPA